MTPCAPPNHGIASTFARRPAAALMPRYDTRTSTAAVAPAFVGAAGPAPGWGAAAGN